MELKLSISSYFVFGQMIFGRVIQYVKSSHKAFVSLLEDTHLGPKQQLKIEVKFFTTL